MTQDGTTVEKSKFDGLMAAHQKALAELRTFKAQVAEPEIDDSAGDLDSEDLEASGAADSSPAEPQYEDGGQYVFEGGQFVPFDPGTPGRHNEVASRTAPRARTFGQEVANLDRMTGKTSARPSIVSWED